MQHITNKQSKLKSQIKLTDVKQADTRHVESWLGCERKQGFISTGEQLQYVL